MRKILLVDDEILVRTNIKLMLQEYKDDLLICGEASNGLEALPLIETLSPDIILCDMQMPEMDGLSLCETLVKKGSTIPFIALSNYDDYHYVRGVLKNGGADYILKHELSPSSLSNLLLNIPIKTDSNDNEQSQNSREALRRRFILSLLIGETTETSDIMEQFNKLEIPLHPSLLTPIVMCIDNYSLLLKKQNLKQQKTIEFSIVTICNDILQGYPYGFLIHIDSDLYCLLLSFHNTHSLLKQDEYIKNAIKQLSSNLKTFLNLSVSFSIGTCCSNLAELPESYELAKGGLRERFYKGNHSILYPSKDVADNDTCISLNSALEHKLRNSLAGSAKDYQTLIEDIFSEITRAHCSIPTSQNLFADLISLINQLARENQIDSAGIYQNPESPSQTITSLNTIPDIKNWFLFCFDHLYEQLHSEQLNYSMHIKNALTIITRDYNKPISLQSVAYEIGISSSYLSSSFKSETGQGFSDYLNHFRIDHATLKIKSGNINFHELAIECGFQDYTYFFKVFKKITGKTPREYLSNC